MRADGPNKTMAATMPSPIDHRRRVLRALGVTPYGLRARFRADVGESTDADDRATSPGASAVDATAACVLVMPGDCGARERQRVAQVMQALGGLFAEAVQVEVTAGELPSVPSARAYLAFGTDQAHALGRALSTEVMAAAEVVLLDAPDALATAAGKRRLWQAVGGLRRLWRDAPEQRG